jgi:Ala-tRNA(Pro) deacylase
MNIPQAICQFLEAAGVAYREVHHEPTTTSEASARARGEDLRIGGKALVLKVNECFAVFVLSAARRVDSSAIKHHLGAKKLRFASPDELYALADLVPGAVPPFGPPILPLDLYADSSILENSRIAFNAGSLTHSIILAIEDYVRVAQPTIFPFSQAQDQQSSML